jgi:ribonuclease BN (tRNA processing enzyme)
MSRRMIVCLLGLFGLVPFASHASAQSCTGTPMAVQVLGSGGPQIKAERASSSYLLWVDDKAKVLIDMGGGAFLRFGQAQAKFGDLAMMGVSHLHPDHISDLPALLWGGRMVRKDPLSIVGPSGNNAAPPFPTFLSHLFDEKNGAFEVLGGVLASPQDFRLEVSTADVTKPEPATVFDRDGLTVTALGIPHGPMPALAYRVTTRGLSVVFSTDQTGTNPRFVPFAKGANVLIMHLAIAAGATSPLHAAPAVVGRIAQEAGVGRLIVSHIGQFDLDAALVELKTAYTGPLTIGADLQCTPVH